METDVEGLLAGDTTRRAAHSWRRLSASVMYTSWRKDGIQSYNIGAFGALHLARRYSPAARYKGLSVRGTQREDMCIG